MKNVKDKNQPMEARMMCVYAGPDSRYWRTGKLSDVGIIDNPNNPPMGFNNQPAPVTPEKVKFCTECGSGNALTNKFCTECGHKFTYPDSDRKDV